MDALLGIPMDRLATVLPLDDEVHDASLGAPGRLRAVYDLALACERADWPSVTAAAPLLNLPEDAIAGTHRAALVYATAALGPVG